MSRRSLHLVFKGAIALTTVVVLGGMSLYARWRAKPSTVWAAAVRRQPNPVQTAIAALGMTIDPTNPRTLTFSPQVLRIDPHLHHRLLPNVRSAWYFIPFRNGEIGLVEQRYFLGPDTPFAREAVRLAGGWAVVHSEQTTNSWGCRGAEPDGFADLRVLIVGDSLMEGMLVADDETPAAQLGRRLGADVLNTGVYGYQPEHYYWCVSDYAPRYRPHIIIINLCGNDADLDDPADVATQREWLRRAVSLGEEYGAKCLVVAVPRTRVLTGEMDDGGYPAVFRGAAAPPAGWLDLTDTFRTAQRGVTRWTDSPLFNGRLHDGHMSPAGAKLWAETVAVAIDGLH